MLILHKTKTFFFHGLTPLQPTQTNSKLPVPTLGNIRGTIYDYSPRAVKEITFSVTVQTFAYLKASAVREQREIVIAYDVRAAMRATAMAARTSKKQLQ